MSNDLCIFFFCSCQDACSDTCAPAMAVLFCFLVSCLCHSALFIMRFDLLICLIRYFSIFFGVDIRSFY